MKASIHAQYSKIKIKYALIYYSNGSLAFVANTPQDLTFDLSDYPNGIIVDVGIVIPTMGAQYFNIVRYTGGEAKTFRVMSTVAQNARVFAVVVYI